MNPLLVLAYKISRLNHRPLHALIDRNGDGLEVLLAPWARWCLVSRASVADRTVVCVEATRASFLAHRVLRAVGAGDFAGRVLLRWAALTRRTVRVISDDLDSVTDVDRDFLQEVAHHDFEIGGKNEWDGADVKHSHHILRLLSETHCRDYFPIAIWSDLLDRRGKRRAPLLALDVGCGPLSWLRYGQLKGVLAVTGLDPLSEVYDVVLARHGLFNLRGVRPDKILAMAVEDLPQRVPHLKGVFDLVWSNNALDHTRDPAASVAAIAFALRPDGIALIQVATNEGSRQHWHQLHQHDFDLDGGLLVSTDSVGHRVTLVGPGCPLELSATLHYGREGLSILAVRPRSEGREGGTRVNVE